MTSIIKVDNIQNSSGTDAVSIDSSGKVSFPNNQPELDIWVQNAQTVFTTSGNRTLTSNWARYAFNWEKIGTGASESSGVFTLPSTGKYKIDWVMQGGTATGADTHFGGYIYTSTNSGTGYTLVSEALSAGHANSTYVHAHAMAFADVTDESTFRVKFNYDVSGTSSTLLGDTTRLRTYVAFTKLSET